MHYLAHCLHVVSKCCTWVAKATAGIFNARWILNMEGSSQKSQLLLTELHKDPSAVMHLQTMCWLLSGHLERATFQMCYANVLCKYELCQKNKALWGVWKIIKNRVMWCSRTYATYIVTGVNNFSLTSLFKSLWLVYSSDTEDSFHECK